MPIPSPLWEPVDVLCLSHLGASVVLKGSLTACLFPGRTAAVPSSLSAEKDLKMLIWNHRSSLGGSATHSSLARFYWIKPCLSSALLSALSALSRPFSAGDEDSGQGDVLTGAHSAPSEHT